jgi:signal transduction histidine kinase
MRETMQMGVFQQPARASKVNPGCPGILSASGEESGMKSDTEEARGEDPPAESGLAGRDLLEILSRNLEEAALFADGEERVRIFNPAAERLFEIPGERLLGRRLNKALPFLPLLRPFESVYEKGEVIHDLEIAIDVARAGASGRETRLLQCSFYPLFDRGGTFLGCFATFADMTRKGLLSREISKSRDLSTIGMLARWMAHEIRNPLSSLNINIELLREELLDEKHLAKKDEVLSLLSFISYETLRLETNLKDFLDFNRLPPPKFEGVALNEVIDSVVRLLRPDAQMKKARIETRYQKNLPPVRVDVSQISLVVSNLLINSIQAVSEKGEIRVITRASAKNAFVVIEDNGQGIPKEDLPRIFDFMFSTKPTGSGLGLSLAKKIISDHHGEILVKSESGKGALFRISLPVAPPQG